MNGTDYCHFWFGHLPDIKAAVLVISINACLVITDASLNP